MTVVTSREMHLAARPSGWPEPDDFELVRRELPVRPHEVLVRNHYLSVDPYMRGRMNDVRSYAPAFALGETMTGGAVGEVVSAPGGCELSRGDLVLHQAGWREYATGDAEEFQRIQPPAGVSPSVYLGALGMPGFTAWVGLTRIAEMESGDSVFVSGAAGAVGGVAGQLAKLRGARRVVGSAGSDDKVRHVLTRGYDAAFNYRDGDVFKQLSDAAGEGGIDIYFDNVGGRQLEAALFALKPFGRVVLCGAVAQYNELSVPEGPRNLALAVGRRLTLRGFIVSDHGAELRTFLNEMEPAVVSGRVAVDETVVDGIEHMVDAFIGMLRGKNVGKMVVRLDG